MSGIFSSLYNLRLKSPHNPLEDYLTEILKYCLERDVELLQKFHIHFGIYEAPFETYSFTTQFKLKALDNHHQGSRPDIALFLEDATIYFENKINSGEGDEQLKRYAEHLAIGDNKPGTLVYITKDYDPKSEEYILKECPNRIRFIPIRWHQIFAFLIPFKEKPLVFELLTFMKNIKLSMNNQFSPTDIITLSNFSPVRKLMDACMFGEVREEFQRINRGVSQESTSLTQLRDHDRYIYWKNHMDGLIIGLGFWMNSENEKPYPEVGIMIQVKPSSSKRNEVVNIFNKILDKDDKWEGSNIHDPSKWATIYCRQSLQVFLSKENHIGEIQEYYGDSLKKVEQISIDYPDLPVIRDEKINVPDGLI